ncbi:flagellar export protein FliJ [Eubacteriaceae bacterium ES3]|nr:flagellar export protein FliJ [Eubacteriaceae bacterium ES3]
MKKFNFKLGKLLTYKDQNLENEMMVLGELNKELDQCEKNLIDQQNKLIQKKKEYEDALSGSISPMACQVHLHYIDAVKEEIKRLEKVLEQARKKVEKQIEVVKNLKLETRSLEIMKEKRYDEYMQEINKETEKELEDFVSTAKEMSKHS